MHALEASCEELCARTGNPPLDCGVLQIICLKNLMIIDVLHRTRQEKTLDDFTPERRDKTIDNERAKIDDNKDHFQKLSSSTPIHKKVAFVQSNCCQPGIAAVHKLPFDPKRVYRRKVQEKKHVD